MSPRSARWSDATKFEQNNANAKDLIQNGRILITGASLSLLSFRHLSVLAQGRLISYINIYIFAGAIYRFLFSLSAAGVSSLEVKYDIFGNADERIWQKHLDQYSTHDR